MAMNETYEEIEPTRARIDQLERPTVVEFGAPLWMVSGHCRCVSIPPVGVGFFEGDLDLPALYKLPCALRRLRQRSVGTAVGSSR
ncbi:MAG: hypothetical protein JWM42_2593 [Burkholderia sp.]|nr:hypothetical protein [Burkholderia sp.]